MSAARSASPAGARPCSLSTISMSGRASSRASAAVSQASSVARCAAQKPPSRRSSSSRPRRQRQPIKSPWASRSPPLPPPSPRPLPLAGEGDVAGSTPINEGWGEGLSDTALHQQRLDAPDRLGRVEPLGTGVDAVHDAAAAIQPVRVFQIVEPRRRRLVARIGDEAVRLQEARRTDEAVGVPPERRARGGAARAQDALIGAVEQRAVLRALQALDLGLGFVV